MIYQIGEFELDSDSYQIHRGSVPVVVEPMTFDLIYYLLSNRNRLVLRQELFDSLWEGREVSDTVLTNHIKSARKALGDDGQLQN